MNRATNVYCDFSDNPRSGHPPNAKHMFQRVPCVGEFVRFARPTDEVVYIVTRVEHMTEPSEFGDAKIFLLREEPRPAGGPQSDLA